MPSRKGEQCQPGELFFGETEGAVLGAAVDVFFVLLIVALVIE